MPVSPKKEKILIIESDASFGGHINEALKSEGYTTILVTNGVEGLKSIYDNLPHLILLDVTLPGADAYDILDKKQKEPMLSKIAVFLLSAQSMPIDMRRVPQNSVAEFVTALHSDSKEIVDKINQRFGYGTEAVADIVTPKNAKKLLWVEDDKLIGTILAKKLVSAGFDLSHAKNGEEAMSMLQNLVPDVVVLDLLLPGMSGFDILQKISMNPTLKKIPVMILSNLSKPSDIERAKILGAKKFLVKAAASLDQIVGEIRALIS